MRNIGPESRKTYQKKLANGFIAKYLGGENVLDIGYKGGDPTAVPIVEHAIGIDLDYPGYDGIRLPFPDESQDAVHSSHCLEHIADYKSALSDWFRVIRTGGFLVIAVPHQYLYEKKSKLPSRWNGDHKRFYTPGRLLAQIEESLPPNSYRIRHLIDNDEGFDYSVSADQHSIGCYEIELIIQKIERPPYSDDLYSSTELDVVKKRLEDLITCYQKSQYVAPFSIIEKLTNPTKQDSIAIRSETLLEIIKLLLLSVAIDEGWYCGTYPDVAEAIAAGSAINAKDHFIKHGYFEGRLPFDIPIDATWYIQNYPDVADALNRGIFGSAHEHFRNFGYLEGRLPFDLNNGFPKKESKIAP